MISKNSASSAHKIRLPNPLRRPRFVQDRPVFGVFTISTTILAVLTQWKWPAFIPMREGSRHAGVCEGMGDLGVALRAGAGVDVLVVREGGRGLAAGARGQSDQEADGQRQIGFVPARHAQFFSLASIDEPGRRGP